MKFGPIKLGGGNKDKKNTKEKKGFLDGSTKKKKESRETVELKLQAELDMIAERYQNTIVSETAKIREKRRNGRDDERNVIRVCDAFYGLLVIKEAKENLEEIRSTTDLCNSMNRMGTALKVLNRLDASQETPNKFTLRRQGPSRDSRCFCRSPLRRPVCADIPGNTRRSISQSAIWKICSQRLCSIITAGPGLKDL